ncbi:hypothetical protein SUGI_0777750 [Cryptomeria japonica]|nr:hypothetical protein SUGI_0777750 [Cryptomeria japonica]
MWKSRPLRAAFVIKNERGKLVCEESIKLLDGTNNDAEYVALLAGKAPSWKARMWLEGIHEILKDLGEYNIRHIYKEANTYAKFLSNHAIDLSEVSIIASNQSVWDGFILAMGDGVDDPQDIVDL